MQSLIKLAGAFVLRSFDLLVSLIGRDKALFSDSEADIDRFLLPHKDIFLQEYLQAREQVIVQDVKDFYKVEKDIGQDDNWKGLPLLIFNHRFEKNIGLCPRTYDLVSKIPGCTSAMFSVLGPGKHIKPHKGIYKGLYRCLFGLKVPENGQCWIRIDDLKIPFEDGKNIIFDETAEHEVMNESDQQRIVLYLDIFRPLPFPLNLLNRLVFSLLRRSYFITNILKEYRKLELAHRQK